MRVLSICAILIATVFLVPMTASAQEALSHLGVRSDNLVNLVYDIDPNSDCPNPPNSTDTYSLFRVTGTGRRDENRFVVPNNQRLVITDILWSGKSGISFDDLIETAEMRLYLHSYTNAGNFAGTIYSSAGVLVERGDLRTLSESNHLTAGIALARKRHICADASQDLESGNAPAWIEKLRIIGYVSRTD